MPGRGVGELADAPVGVGLARADELVAVPELDADAGGRRARSVSSTWVETVMARLYATSNPANALRPAAQVSLPEPRRLAPVLAGDLRLVGTDELAVADDVAAADEQPVDPVRGREDEARDGVVGAAELEPVRPPDREVGALAGLERADVVAAAARAAPPRVASRSASRALSAPAPPRPRATRSACFTSKKRSPRSFDAEPSTPSPTRDAGVEQLANRRDAGAEPEVRGRAVGDADAAGARSARSRPARGGCSGRTRRRRRASRPARGTRPGVQP